MVKIALDTGNYDKVVETIKSLDFYIKEWEKEDSKLNKFDNLIQSIYKNGKILTSKRNEIRLLKKRSHLFSIPYFEKDIQHEKKLGRPKKNNALKPGRPKIIFGKNPLIEEYCESLLKLSIFHNLFYVFLDDNNNSVDIILIETNSDGIKRINDNDFCIMSISDIDYVPLQILYEYNMIILFRFLDPILNNALIIRLPKIIKVLQDKNLIFEKWLYPELRNSL